MENIARKGLPFGKNTNAEVLEEIQRTGLSGEITDLCMFPTYKCNLDCYMCHVHYSRVKNDPYLSLEEIKEKYDKIEFKKMFYLGGESFVRPDMIEILRYFDQRGIEQIVSTNGTQITEKLAKQIAELSNLVCIQVSLNGTKEIDAKIRGNDAAFDKTVEGIKLLRKHNVQTWIHTVIMNDNIHDLDNIIKIGSELDVNTINFLFAQVMSEKDKQDTVDIVKKWIGEEVHVGGYVGKIEYSRDDLLNAVKSVKEKGKEKGIPIMFFPKVFGEQPELYWDDTLLEQERPICQMALMPPLTPAIGPEGDVFGCCIIDKSFGNIKEQTIDEIWNSPKMQAFRKGLMEDKLMPVCKRCPSGDLFRESLEEASMKLDEWNNYLDKLTQAMNNNTKIGPVIESISPLVFQYSISDNPEYNYWHKFDAGKVSFGIGTIQESLPTIHHKTDHNTLIKVNSGETNPIQATMDGIYVVEGDTTKLMACAPLIPITVEAHEATLN
jgi:radical SAM protein with 4Fe4S-binding SPASM domain